VAAWHEDLGPFAAFLSLQIEPAIVKFENIQFVNCFFYNNQDVLLLLYFFFYNNQDVLLLLYFIYLRRNKKKNKLELLKLV